MNREFYSDEKEAPIKGLLLDSWSRIFCFYFMLSNSSFLSHGNVPTKRFSLVRTNHNSLMWLIRLLLSAGDFFGLTMTWKITNKPRSAGSNKNPIIKDITFS